MPDATASTDQFRTAFGYVTSDIAWRCDPLATAAGDRREGLRIRVRRERALSEQATNKGGGSPTQRRRSGGGRIAGSVPDRRRPPRSEGRPPDSTEIDANATDSQAGRVARPETRPGGAA